MRPFRQTNATLGVHVLQVGSLCNRLRVDFQSRIFLFEEPLLWSVVVLAVWGPCAENFGAPVPERVCLLLRFDDVTTLTRP